MRAHVHDQAVRFRCNAALVRAAEAKARKNGMSLSELLRGAVRKELQEIA
jgi:predicted HicB family RNase H-like nuclease